MGLIESVSIMFGAAIILTFLFLWTFHPHFKHELDYRVRKIAFRFRYHKQIARFQKMPLTKCAADAAADKCIEWVNALDRTQAVKEVKLTVNIQYHEHSGKALICKYHPTDSAVIFDASTEYLRLLSEHEAKCYKIAVQNLFGRSFKARYPRDISGTSYSLKARLSYRTGKIFIYHAHNGNHMA